eukprot:TRINITY_DN102_c1_g1_i1.p1 TRINITY_DN102_c1_g1~~TRINITY_DN102_c1_g1_i1.p1  ORF type:complete len:594 (+),score=123.45 TRINITY_DN102_c1_g1_i1:69-1784(+)
MDAASAESAPGASTQVLRDALQSNAAESSSGDQAGGGPKMPENLARLPPKLRARLLQRGIIKEADLQPGSAGGGGASQQSTAPTPAVQSSSSRCPGTPPEVPPEASMSMDASSMPAMMSGSPGTPPGTPPEMPVALEPPLTSLGPPADAVEFLPSSWASLAASAKAKAAPVQSKASPAQFKSAPAVPGPSLDAGLQMPANWASLAASAKAKPAPVKTTYSSAPVLSKDALEKKRALEAGAEESAQSSESKRQVVESPASVRAAAARAEAAGSAPTWVMKDGVVTEVGSNGSVMAATVSTPAAPVSQAFGGCAATHAAVQPAVAAPAGEPPLPPGWVSVPHEGDFYYWNTTTNEVSWEHPFKPKAKEPEPQFTEEHKILWTDLGKIIGRQGINLKIIKASIGCTIRVPKSSQKGKDKGKGKGKGKDGKDGKNKHGTKEEAREKGVGRGIGMGDQKLADDQFVTVKVTADTAYAAKGGKRCLEVMLGYGRNVEAALGLLGVEVKMPSLDEMTDGKASKAQSESKAGLDPMDPAAYSDAPVGQWSSGMKKTSGRGTGGGKGEPADSKTANAERF